MENMERCCYQNVQTRFPYAMTGQNTRCEKSLECDSNGRAGASRRKSLKVLKALFFTEFQVSGQRISRLK